MTCPFQTLLQAFWARLTEVNSLVIKTQTVGSATGSVSVKKNETTLLFHETGAWDSQLTFYNVLNWQNENGRIFLSHLRFGKNRPVALLELKIHEEGRLSSVTPHLCNQDLYKAHIHWNPTEIHLVWQITGPHKNEKIDVCYF